MSLNSGLWSNLLRETAITATFYFPEEEECMYTLEFQIDKTPRLLIILFFATQPNLI